MHWYGWNAEQFDVAYPKYTARAGVGDDVAKAQSVIDGMRGDISFGEALADENIGKLSIVGVGMRSHSGIAAKVFEVLAAAGVNIQMISTSEIKISVVIGIDKAEEATREVHDAFLG